VTVKTHQADSLYPPIEPYRTGYLRVDPNHRVYFEESGNPRGKPVVFLHGGPGAGAAVQEHHWLPPGIAAFLEIDAMIRVHAKVSGAVGFDGGIQGVRLMRLDCHADLTTACSPE